MQRAKAGRVVVRQGTGGPVDWGAVFAVAILLGPAVPRSHGMPAYQCPDGTPPPCARERRPAPPDPNRIAILPFRVTAADTLLGQGLAELLATEFTGERGPRAVHMGTVLRVWRRVGGNVRTPLGEAQAMRVAREVDAGRLVDGSVVGLGSRLTLSASVVSLPDGGARRVGPVSGPTDSLEVLVGRLASGLLGATGQQGGVALRGSLTASPSAMGAYIEGLAAFRLYRPNQAASAFERAFMEDPTFARAAFMRFVVAPWGAGGQAEWAQRVWSLRNRLPPADRLLLFAHLGEAYPAPRSPRQELADLERAAALLPESPEAQYLLGDWLFHTGAAADVSNRLERAITQFQRSLALDTQETVRGHLIYAAVLQGDTMLVQALRGSLETQGAGVWDASWLAAAWLGDRPWLDQLFARGPTADFFHVLAAAPAGVPPALIEERFDRRPFAQSLRFLSPIVQGRPAAAIRVALAAPRSINRETWIVIAGLFADGDSAAAAAAVERLAAWPVRDSAEAAAARCPVALWRAREARFEPGAEAMLRRHGQERCAVALELWRSWQAGGPDLEVTVAKADSFVRWNVFDTSFENVLLARVWEAQGNLPRALAAVRLRPDGNPVWTEATGARMEGRLAALVGDTVAAVRAYRRYLNMRRYAEPVLIPQRDSVQAELARLEGRRR